MATTVAGTAKTAPTAARTVTTAPTAVRKVTTTTTTVRTAASATKQEDQKQEEDAVTLPIAAKFKSATWTAAITKATACN